MIIWGFKTYASVVATVSIVCSRCHNPAAHRLHKVVRRFTFFFIPMFATSTRYLLDCTFCGMQHPYTKAEGTIFEERILADQIERQMSQQDAATTSASQQAQQPGHAR